MKKKMCMAIVAIVLLVGIPTSGYSALVYEKFDDIIGTESFIIDLTGYVSPSNTYVATITDASESPIMGFEKLYMAIFQNATIVDSIVFNDSADIFTASADNQGGFSFTIDPGETYRAYIFGTGGGNFGAGLFEFKVSSVPIPATLLLLGSGLFALAALKRRKLQ